MSWKNVVRTWNWWWGRWRQLRIQYSGTLYHVINRGNYRTDEFATVERSRATPVSIERAVYRCASRATIHDACAHLDEAIARDAANWALA